MPAFDDVLQLIISKDELLELYSVLASGAHQDDLLRASQALLSLWPPEHTGLPVHGVFHEVLLQGILVRLSPRHDPDTVPFHDDNDEAPGYVLRPLHRVVVPDSAAASGGESTGLEVELCHVEGRLQPNSDAGLNASAAADAAGPGRWHGADDGLHAGMGPGGDAAMGGVDGAQAQPASAPSQSSSCSCSWCQYLTWRGVFRLPLEKLWPEPEEEEQAGASDAEGRASWELGYMIAREELFGAHALFLHPAAAPPVTVAVLQLLRSLACRLRLRHAISQHASARKQLQARLQAVTSELSDAKQQAREELEAEPGLGPTRGQPGQPLPVAASSASASRLRRDTALEQWRVQQQRWRTGKGQVEQLKQRADELERQRQAVIVELKQVMNAERAAEQQADLLEADAGELLQSLTEAVHEERRQRNARHNAEPAPHAAAAAAAAAVPQQAAADQEAGGSFEPPLSKRPRLEQHAADAADGLRGPAAAGTVTGGDGGRTASDDWSCVQPNGQRLGGLAAMPPSHQPQAPQDPGVGPGRPGVAGDHSKWSALQKEYLLARAMMLRLADMHGAVSGDGSQQQQQQQLSLQAQPHLMYTHPHPHQQLQRQPGLQLQQPVQQAQPWQSAVSLAPAAPAATRSHPHHHQQPQPAITSAFAWEGAVELVWAPQASASVPGSAGATAAPSRIVQCLPGARLLVSPLPASPRLKIDRAFSGLAALLQQAGVTVLPIVAAAKDKQV
ncbi:hypothetical protein HXX76_011513 [Chlamydomonas incerta]|uniref:Uncharacterized protein n=1 Tax=Chlamydomonas incerta TaxID=51695 RepID=A0A835SKL1_CHLIN|nr:hypothetical protein HXX76_011513 [Chlamydomonas incerta]|eukprot:KAG2428813.1 hypothetical protein HXX76_011513 [Chlamydomonas incerta]